MDYLQKWWEEKYPNAGVEKIANVSEGVIDVEHLIDFEQWLVKNFDLYRVSKRSELIKATSELLDKAYNYGIQDASY